MFFADNLKFLRTRKEKSQTAMAEELELKRTSLIGYEKGVQPTFGVVMKLADYFKVSIDALLRYDLSKLGKFELSQIEQGFDVDITGKKLRLLVTTTDTNGEENIEMIRHQAQAGYTQGYNDPEYIESLPKFQLPFLSRNKTYRCFQIKGDSMPPLSDGSWVTASFIQDWNTIKNGTPCVVITKEDGIVFKLVYNQIKENQEIMLVSSNRSYAPYNVSIDDLAEVWKFETYNAFEV
ncbi:MAG: transcriptional regulator [Crocinitomicaceae bacterium]|nr:transcriptional regulator [Crocinitomicaceae bacterium]|tara:strand:- start:3796 stop:4503 length:708 start_codon:yes stop_codon:yes gene_type:complete